MEKTCRGEFIAEVGRVSVERGRRSSVMMHTKVFGSRTLVEWIVGRCNQDGTLEIPGTWREHPFVAMESFDEV